VLTARTFKVVALLAETFVFVYLGMAAFALPIFKNTTWRLVGVALPACLLGRCHVYVLSALVNCWRRHLRTRELRLAAAATPSGVASALGMKSRVLPDISRTYQHVMVFSGLRGGVAFAIASVGFSHEDFTAHDDSLAIMQVRRHARSHHCALGMDSLATKTP
jgi:sodium/hydrogen exchanger 8